MKHVILSCTNNLIVEQVDAADCKDAIEQSKFKSDKGTVLLAISLEDWRHLNDNVHALANSVGLHTILADVKDMSFKSVITSYLEQDLCDIIAQARDKAHAIGDKLSEDDLDKLLDKFL